VADALVRDPRVGKVMFTGSVKTGMKVIEASAGNMPRLTLELGGNDAAIVLSDVDPQAIAEGLFWGAFINNGQTCAAMKRLYVPDAIYDEVVDALAALAAKIPMGVGLDEGNVLGPLQNQMQWNVVNRLVEDAKVRGARVVMGGDPDTAAPSSGPTASTSASARRCGPPTATRLSPSPRGCKPGRCGSTATAASTRACRSAAPSARIRPGVRRRGTESSRNATVAATSPGTSVLGSACRDRTSSTSAAAPGSGVGQPGRDARDGDLVGAVPDREGPGRWYATPCSWCAGRWGSSRTPRRTSPAR
jgi:Aldehyde dehydrogenase family